MTEQTTDQPADTQRLASAITHIANGLMCDPNTAPGAMMAHELVRDLVQPQPSPAPAPSCDAPHCDCATGEDCKANGVAEPVQVVGIDTAAKTGPFPWTFTFRQEGDDMVIDDGCGRATVIKGGAKPPRPEDKLFVLPPAPDLAARLDGLKAAVDALAERLERKAGNGIEVLPPGVKATDLPRDPMVARLDRKRDTARPVWIVKLREVLTVSGQGTVWVIDTKSRKDDFDFGTCVTDREDGQIMEVVGIASQEGNHSIGLTVRPLS